MLFVFFFLKLIIYFWRESLKWLFFLIFLGVSGERGGFRDEVGGFWGFCSGEMYGGIVVNK